MKVSEVDAVEFEAFHTPAASVTTSVYSVTAGFVKSAIHEAVSCVSESAEQIDIAC